MKEKIVNAPSRFTADHHLHTCYSDGSAGVRAMVEAAVQKGFGKIAITDHMPLPVEKRYAMKLEMIEPYRAEIRRVREDFVGVIEVRLGLEMEYLPGFETWTEKIVSPGWEHAILSVHNLIHKGRWGMVNGTRQEFERLLYAIFDGDIRALCTCYHSQIRKGFHTGLFDVVGHLDVLKKHNRDDAYFSEDEKWYRELMMETLDAAASSPMAVEINLSGIDHPAASPYPSPWIIAGCACRGIPMVLSSDAHRPENIGRNFEKIPLIIGSVGMPPEVNFFHAHSCRGFEI